jgi:hypothetical protein
LAIKSYFVIDVNRLPILKEYDHYPSEAEIEQEIYNRFPGGFILDQFSNEKIYPVAQVKKFYKLSNPEEEEE